MHFNDSFTGRPTFNFVIRSSIYAYSMGKNNRNKQLLLTAISQNISDGVAQCVKKANSNRNLASSMLTLGKRVVVSLRKTVNANIPTSSSTAQWIRAKVSNRNDVDFRFGS